MNFQAHTWKHICIIAAGILVPFGAVVAEGYPETPKAVGSNRFRMEVNGQPVPVYKFKDVHYAQFPYPNNNSAQIKVQARRAFNSMDLSPKSAGIDLTTELESMMADFEMSSPRYLVVSMDDKERLFIFAEQRISSPVHAINVMDHGADPGGHASSTIAIQTAIDTAPPGATVRVPPGHYLSGSLFIRSGITLFIEAGALLQASGNPKDFEPVQNAFIVIEDASDVTLTGRGVIDGSGAYLRHLTDESGRLLAIRNSKNIKVEGIILRDPRAWNTHLINSEHVVLRDLKILNDRNVSNTDGIDPDSSRHVLIEGNFFYCGDDAVAIKSTNRDGNYADVYDITVKNNIMLTHKSALKVGTETHASEMKDITFENNQVIECDRGMSLYARDGTHMHNIQFIGNRFENPYPDYYQRLLHLEIKKRSGLSRISNILIQDCTADVEWRNASLIKGFSDTNGISNVRFINFRYGGKLCNSLSDANVEVGQYAANVSFEILE